jgi:hypothetical protein
MKKIIILIFLPILSWGQIAVADFVHLEDGADKDYHTLEQIWKPFHLQEISEGKKVGWAVWKFDKTPEMDKAPNYLVFNFFKDENQAKLYADNFEWEAARKKIESLNKGKFSRTTLRNIFNKKIKNEVRQYTIKLIKQTVLAGGKIKIGDKLSFGAMKQLNDDYEDYELNVFMPMWEKQLLKGKIKQWTFTEVIAKNDVALDKTHMTFIINNDANPNDVQFISSNKWANDKIIEHGLKSRDFVSAEATLIYTSN